VKTQTDIHWNERAASVADDFEVNIMDVFQRELEYDHVCRYLSSDMTVVEVGCGNGYSTRRFRELVKHVDAFDYAENMIERAKASGGETNNRFIHDNLLAPQRLSPPYDTVICVRVLINLRDLEQQLRGVDVMASLLRPGGALILVEGFRDGFHELSRLRGELGLPPVEPAAINFYSSLEDLQPALDRSFALEDRFHLGSYDFLTRVLYPLLVGPDNVRHNTSFSERCSELARVFNPDSLEHLSRVRGFFLRKSA
jgi:SAM-dependent methyltransferase